MSDKKGITEKLSERFAANPWAWIFGGLVVPQLYSNWQIGVESTESLPAPVSSHRNSLQLWA